MELREILNKVRSGEIDVDSAVNQIRLLGIEEIGDQVKFDLGRSLRRDVPEIVLAEGKTPDTVVTIVNKTTKVSDLVVVSRLSTDHVNKLRDYIDSVRDLSLELNSRGRIAVVKKVGFEVTRYPCKVGVITAGTADVPIAEEAVTIIKVMGCEPIAIYDVGVAGMQRVIQAVKRVKEEDVDAVIVVAGMEGALASVVSSLLDLPVIGVPTSVGYGAGGRGIAALLSMLQACPLGLTVVNIDNGINAAIVASLMAKRVGLLRRNGKE
jgi:NCAIR mutase (PurE)-related protein